MSFFNLMTENKKWFVAEKICVEDIASIVDENGNPIAAVYNILKQEDEQRLLAFSRSLNVAERTLTGMGPQYVGDLSHTNTLR